VGARPRCQSDRTCGQNDGQRERAGRFAAPRRLRAISEGGHRRNTKGAGPRQYVGAGSEVAKLKEKFNRCSSTCVEDQQKKQEQDAEAEPAKFSRLTQGKKEPRTVSRLSHVAN